MNAKQYVRKYHLEPGDSAKFDRNALIDDFGADFKTSCVGAGLIGSHKISKKSYHNLIDMAKIKWDKIFIGSKIKREEFDGLWKVFYAKYVAPIRFDLYVKSGIIEDPTARPTEISNTSKSVEEMSEIAEHKLAVKVKKNAANKI